MKVKKARELRKLIYDIYYNGEDPQKFKEVYGKDDYLEQLYPKDENQIVGPWIEENFGYEKFIDVDQITELFRFVAEQTQEIYFYANIPDRETIEQRVEVLCHLEEEHSGNSRPIENLGL